MIKLKYRRYSSADIEGIAGNFAASEKEFGGLTKTDLSVGILRKTLRIFDALVDTPDWVETVTS